MRLEDINPRWRQAAVYLAILAFSCCLVALEVRAHPQLSVIDEFQHADYLYQTSHGQLVRTGRIVGQETMREAACRGFDVEIRVPSCDAPHTPDQFPGSGLNTAALNPPTYYAITAVLARLLTATGVVHNLLTAGRLVGGLWLGLGLILLWRIAADLGATTEARVIMTVLFAAAAPVLYMAATVNPETTSVFAGGLILWAALRWEDHRWRMALLPVVGALGVSMRTTTLICVLAVALYLVIRAVPVRQLAGKAVPGAWKTHGSAALLLLGGATVAQLAWLFARRSLALPTPPPSQPLLHATSLPLTHLIVQAYALVTPIDWYSPFAVQRGPFLTSHVGGALLLVGVRALGWLLLAACLGSILYARRWDREQALSIAGFAILVVGGPLLLLSTYLSEHQDFTVPARYAFSLLPMLGAVAAKSLSNTLALRAAEALAAACLLLMLYVLIQVHL